MADVNDTLSQRGERYGEFKSHALITQSLKKVMRKTDNWDLLTADQQEALEMVAHKIGRILNGDPNYSDSWHDISGYATLVEQSLPSPEQVKAPEAPAPLPPPVAPVNAQQAPKPNTDIPKVEAQKVPDKPPVIG